MTSSGHVTSSGGCPNNSPWALSYRLSIGTIPLGYLASFPRYLARKLRQRLLRDDVINDVVRPGSTIREYRTIQRNIVLNFVQVRKNCRGRCTAWITAPDPLAGFAAGREEEGLGFLVHVYHLGLGR